MKIMVGLALVSVALSGCASASIVPMSKNTVAISTRAAPICHTTGAVTVAKKMAAITTIKNGYERFIVMGFGAQDNTRVVTTGPTYARTTGQVTSFGNTAYGTANTTYGGQMTFVSGGNNAEMQVTMLSSGDPGFDQGIDAKATLGPDWQKIVDNGINTCF